MRTAIPCVHHGASVFISFDDTAVGRRSAADHGCAPSCYRCHGRSRSGVPMILCFPHIVSPRRFLAKNNRLPSYQAEISRPPPLHTQSRHRCKCHRSLILYLNFFHRPNDTSLTTVISGFRIGFCISWILRGSRAPALAYVVTWN